MVRGAVGGGALLVILVLLAWVAAPGSSSTEVEGVYAQWEPMMDLESPHVQRMAKFAVNQYNAQAHANLELKRVVKGESRADMILYHLTLEVTPSGYYDAYVNWLNFRNLVSFDPTSKP